MKPQTKLAMILSLLLLILPGSVFASYTWYYNPDTTHYYALTESPSPWTQAEAAAVAQGGHLVTINDSAEQTWLDTTFPGSGANSQYWYFIGYHQNSTAIEPSGNWAWISGETSSYENWATGEPNNSGGNEDYAHMNRYGDGRWNDVPNATYPMQGIIESTVPLPGALLLLGAGLVRLAAYRRRRQS